MHEDHLQVRYSYAIVQNILNIYVNTEGTLQSLKSSYLVSRKCRTQQSSVIVCSMWWAFTCKSLLEFRHRFVLVSQMEGTNYLPLSDILPELIWRSLTAHALTRPSSALHRGSIYYLDWKHQGVIICTICQRIPMSCWNIFTSLIPWVPLTFFFRRT